MKSVPLPLFAIYIGYVLMECLTFYMDPTLKAVSRTAVYTVLFVFILKRSKGVALLCALLHLVGGLLSLAAVIDLMGAHAAAFRIGVLAFSGVFQLCASAYLFISKDLKAYQNGGVEDDARNAWLKGLGQ